MYVLPKKIFFLAFHVGRDKSLSADEGSQIFSETSSWPHLISPSELNSVNTAMNCTIFRDIVCDDNNNYDYNNNDDNIITITKITLFRILGATYSCERRPDSTVVVSVVGMELLVRGGGTSGTRWVSG